MNNRSRLSSVALALTLGASLLAPRPAAANGAASTRNIIFGAAALGAGTLIVLNHNKKVHQKYAEYDRRQAQTQAEANQAEAAYESERSAYGHEAAMVGEYQKETAYQHSQVVARNREIASLRHSLVVAKYGANAHTVASAPAHARLRHRTVVAKRHQSRPQQRVMAAASHAPELVSYGWGNY